MSSTDSASSVRLCVSGNIGHYGCHVVRVLASVGDRLRRQTDIYTRTDNVKITRGESPS